MLSTDEGMDEFGRACGIGGCSFDTHLRPEKQTTDRGRQCCGLEESGGTDCHVYCHVLFFERRWNGCESSEEDIHEIEISVWSECRACY